MRKFGQRSPLLYVYRAFLAIYLPLFTMQTDNPLRPPPLAYNIGGYDFRDGATIPPDIAARTDDSTGSDDAWAASCSALHDVERDYFDDQAPAISTTTGPDDDDGESDDASGTGDEPVARALRAPLQRSVFQQHLELPCPTLPLRRLRASHTTVCNTAPAEQAA